MKEFAPTNTATDPFRFVQVEERPNDQFKVLGADTAESDFMNTQIEQWRTSILSEVESDESGLDIARVNSFLSKKGMLPKPFVIIDPSELDHFKQVIGAPANSILPVAAYTPQFDFVFVLRDPDLEDLNGPEITESRLVHEQAHANNNFRTKAFWKYSDGRVKHEEVRTGFSILGDNWTEGSFYEEGFAELMSHKYITEELGLKGGLYDWPGSARLIVGDPNYRYPGSYLYNGGMTMPIHAAYGVELLIAKDPTILDAMHEARKTTEGLRMFANKVEALSTGLYTKLRKVAYDGISFVNANGLIVQTLYGGDYDKAVNQVGSKQNKFGCLACN